MKESKEIKKYLDRADVIILVLDLEGEIQLINAKGCTILGYSEGELLGKNWFDHFIPGRLRASVKKAFQQITTGDPRQVEFFENPVLTGSGDEKLVAWRNEVLRDEEGRVIEILSTGEDVTIRRQTENALIESEATLRAILDTCVDGIITIDETGRILSFNPAAVRIFGYRPDEALGKDVSLLMPDPYRTLHNEYLHRYLRTREARIIGRGREVVGRRKNGSTFPLYLAVSDVNVRGRKMFTGVARDLTDFKKMQEEIIQSQKLAAIGEMAASVAHEIKNPLAGISGAIEILRDTFEEPDERREVMEEILLEVKRLDNTVRDLLAFSRPWNPDTQWCDLRELIERVTRLFLEQDDLGDLEFKVNDSSEIRVKVDPWLFEKVLWNLLDNASDAMDGEGLIEFHFEESPGYITVTVEDNGAGIPIDQQDNVFRPFFTTKSRGTGLGLAICKKIMDAHGGSISLFSIPKKGTRVSVKFPAEAAPAPAS
ncbi:MAG: PAS domain S-box protein [Acidobacteriota bacterium]|nr:MAG: PAS domain S-box protein [Acidobacteriota bacterium]